MKDEYLLPTIIGGLVRSGMATVEVLPTEDAWFGMTYPADKPKVEAAIRTLIETGIYREGEMSNDHTSGNAQM